MAKTISQRISLEGSEELQKQLVALGQAGAEAFQQIQKAAEKPIADPAQLQKTKEAVDGLVTSAQSLAKQFQPLNDNIKQFGAAGTQSTQQVTAGLNQTSTAAQQASTTIQKAGQSAATAGENAGSSLLSAAQVFGIAAAGIVAAMSAIVSSLTKGVAETSKEVSNQAGQLNLSIPQMQQLRTAAQGTSLANKEFAGSLSKVSDLMQKGAGYSQFLTGSLRQQTIAVKDGFVTISAFGMRAKDRLYEMKREGSKAATELRKLGASGEAIATGDSLRGMREIAANIDRQTDATKKAQLGNQAFGDSWRETTDALIQSMLPIDKSTASLAELGKMNRQLSEADVGLGKELTKQTNDLSNAVRAVKDQVGALFLGPATTKAKWLTDMVDGTAELFRQWSGLNQMQKEGFLAGLGQGPAQTAFKILVALGQQLAGIWRDVLVPAGRQLVAIVGQITGSMKGATTAQITAGFVTLAVAAVGLAVALRGIGVVLGPLAALFSAVFSPLGLILGAAAVAAVLFWDQFKAAANSALAIIPQQVAQIKRALQLLFTGDFAGAWALFEEAATTALEDIGRKLQTTKGILADFFRALTGGVVELPWVQELVKVFKEIGAELPAAILLIATAFLTLRRASVAAATAIKRIFGIELTGTGLAMILIIGQFSGVLTVLASVAVTVGAAFTVLSIIVGGLAAVFGTVPVALAALTLLLAVAIKLIIVFWDEIKAGAGAGVAAIVNFVSALASIAWGVITDGAVAAWNAIIAAVQEAGSAIAEFAASLLGIAWDAIASGASSAWAAITSGAAGAKAAVLEFAASLGGIAWDAIKSGAEAAWAWIKQKIAETKAAVLDFAASLGRIVWGAFAAAGVAAWNAIIAAIEHTIGVLLRLSSIKLPESMHSVPFGEVWPGKAGGGLMGGRGTGTSDSNLVWLSRGEHVMPARAVRQPGMLAFLEALRRSGGDLSRVIDRMGHFALGGLVPRPMAIPAFASGGLAGGNNVTIQFPGLPPISGLRASSGVVDELRKAAALAQVRSGGRKPSRYS